MIYQELKKRYKKIIGWGTGGAYDKYGKTYEEYLSYLIDSNSLKWGTTMGKVCIESPDYLLQEDSSECIIVIFSSYVSEICESIKSIGDFDVIAGNVVDYFCEKQVELYQTKESLQMLTKLNWNKVVCCVSTMAYTASVGGGNKFVTEQNRVLEANGYGVLHIVPVQYYQSFFEDEMLWITYNEKTLGVYSLNEIITYIEKCRTMIIHSPYYAIRLIRKIYNGMKKLRQCLFYLHDFACVCSRRFLPVEDKECFEELKKQCIDCKDGQNRMLLYHEYKKLFYNDNVLLIAPSQIVIDKVSQVYKEAHYKVIPHYEYEIDYAPKKVNNKLKIAFVGAATRVKGWEAFKKIVLELKDTYEFYCFGKCDDKIDDVEYVEIHMEGTAEQLCMKDALIKYEIDMAYLGSICCETYSFTYIEAFECGTYVLTTEKSGNICESVKKNKNGYVAEDTDDLIRFLKKEDMELKNIILEQNRKAVNITYNLSFLDCI